MENAHAFLKALAIVLCVAAATTFLFQRLRQPVVLGYILAGLIVGPHVTTGIVADVHIVETLSELGVILLMFSLGLEFSIRRFVQVVPTAGLAAVIECSVMLWLGYLTGRAFGWNERESIFAGAIVAISSTTIVVKAFDEQRVRGKLRELVVGVLIAEDLIAIVLLATLTAIGVGDDVSFGTIARSVGRLGAFLAGLIVVGLFVVPRIMRGAVRLRRAETTLVTAIGVCFAIALLTDAFGYSVALGAFIAGSLVAESGEVRRIAPLVQPVRDVFAAIFFVSVGMLLDPMVIAANWPAVLVLVIVVLVGKSMGVTLGTFLAGSGTRMSMQAGMSLAQIGEFSFIIAALGMKLRATGEFLLPIAIAVSAVTTLTTPWFIRGSAPAAAYADRKLPRPLQTFAALYGSWLERLRTSSHRERSGAATRRLVRWLVLDTVIVGAIIITTSVSVGAVAAIVKERFGSSDALAAIIVGAAALVLGGPFAVGIFRIVRSLGITLAEAALPKNDAGKVDFDAAPRRALVVTLQLALFLLVCLPLLAVTQPFLPNFQGAIVVALLAIALGIVFWKSATNLQGHVRAGAEIIVEALKAQAQSRQGPADETAFATVRGILPGLGEPTPVTLDVTSVAVGRTLAELNLRGITGATVIAIKREGRSVVPSANEVLEAGDVLALAGTQESIKAARVLLKGDDLPTITHEA